MRAMQTEVLGELYKLQEPIGRGGMATIYRGQDLRMDRVVAIKVLREVYSTDPKFVTRFQREAKAASALQHPNIVQVYDYGQTDGNYFIVMELVEGTDLRRYLRSRGVLAVDRAIIIAHDVALGLGAAHRRGIVHRDVKPQNVLVGRDGSIKLTDFGIASVYKDINAERLTTTGMTLGTVQYYAPEQAQGEIVSPAADVYALGIVMYEMLTGRTPFDGDTPVAVAMQHIQDLPTPPSHFNPNIPPALEEIILRCLEKAPEMRYSDGSALARALELLGDPEMDEILPGTVTPGQETATNVPNYVNYADGSMASGTQPPSISSPNNGMGASAFNHQGNHMSRSPDPLVLPHQQPYNAPLESSTGYGTRPRPNAVPHDQRDSRFAGIITVLILLATLLLLGFSIYLAAELGFIHIPGIANPNPTSTNTVLQFPVPDLRGLTYQEALSKATTAGFKLGVSDGNTAGVVIRQAPNPSNLARKGTSIQVKFAVTHQTVVVPAGLVGEPLSVAEQILTNDGIPYSLQPDGSDTNRPANTVSRVSPPSGTSIPKGQSVILYVVNYTNGTPTVTPEPTATATSRPSPTATPTPKSTVTPNPSPDPIPDPDPIP
ncbi:MAG: Stk1 family PASTA domain-containing Ser/Thr kinase [Chloroflexi bacterium]|nr:MAG: Stk1 family PASTA domain-containing Ser/Thr kinase [Chloroflexota bacterium]